MLLLEVVRIGEIFDLIRGNIQNSKVIEDINGITFISSSKKFKKIELIPNNTIITGSNLFIATTMEIVFLFFISKRLETLNKKSAIFLYKWRTFGIRR